MNLIKSIASRHYPRIIFREGERMLWNPLNKKVVRMRPEERVRLQFLDYLILQSSISPTRISVESPVPSRYSRGRTDILCYDTGVNPLLLVECKSENIKPGAKAAIQSATYNRFIKAPYIMLTNGVQDALFDVGTSLRPVGKKEYPSMLCVGNSYFDVTPDYWKSRGFLAEKMPEFIAAPFAYRLALLFQASSETISYLSMNHPTDHRIPISHYYALLEISDYPDCLIAVTIRALDRNRSMLCAVSNRDKNNMGCLTVTISEIGEFHSPQLFIAGHSEIIEPDISELESIWNTLEQIVVPSAPGKYGEGGMGADPVSRQRTTSDSLSCKHPAVKNMKRMHYSSDNAHLRTCFYSEALCFSERLSSALTSIFIPHITSNP